MRGFFLFYISMLFIVVAVVVSTVRFSSTESESIFVKEKTGHVSLLNVEESRRRIENSIQSFGRQGYFPSFTVGVVIGDSLAYRYCYNTDIHRAYYIASITKIFTALAVMQLVEDGDVNLDAPIRDYLPGVHIARSELGSSIVTVRHLLSHSSGLPDIRYYCPPVSSRADGIDIRIPGQIYPAGSHYRYANHGFILLGHLVEMKSHTSFGRYLRNNVFDPNNMNDAKTHRKLNGAGGIAVSMNDMANFASMWLQEGMSVSGKRLLDEETVEKMLAQQLYIPFADVKRYVGLGWRVRADRDGVLTFFHIGGANGVAAWVQIFPRYNCAVIYLGNPHSYTPELMWFLSRMQDRLAELATYMVGSDKNINEFKPTLPTEENMKNFVGNYRNPLNNSITTVYLRNDVLCLSNRKENIRLRPYTSHIFQGGREMIFYDFVHKPGKRKPEGLATYYGYFKRIQ